VAERPVGLVPGTRATTGHHPIVAAAAPRCVCLTLRITFNRPLHRPPILCLLVFPRVILLTPLCPPTRLPSPLSLLADILLSSPDEGRALLKIADLGFAKRLHPAYFTFHDARGARRPDSYDLPPPPDIAAAHAAQREAAAAAAAAGAAVAGTAGTATGGRASATAGAAAPVPQPPGPWDPSELGLTTSCGTPSYVSPGELGCCPPPLRRQARAVA
jgi:hypothetical protein